MYTTNSKSFSTTNFQSHSVKINCKTLEKQLCLWCAILHAMVKIQMRLCRDPRQKHSVKFNQAVMAGALAVFFSDQLTLHITKYKR